jgi:hypothetical protein
MDLVKKNLVSIICGAVAILAVAAIFYPINGFYQSLNQDVQKRAAIHTTVRSILTKQRNLPELGLDPVAEPKRLDQFPTKQVIEVWKAATDKVKEQSGEVLKAAVEMNTHTLLVPGSLPQSTPDTALDFRAKYTAEMDMNGPGRANSLAVRTLKAGFLATPEQVMEGQRQAEADFKLKVGEPGSDANLIAQLTQEKSKVRDVLNAKVRDSSKLYVEPKAVEPYGAIMTLGPGAAPEAGRIYIAQVNYWIQKDVLEAIAAANKDAKDVTDSPVKHLFYIKFPQDAFKLLEPLPSGSPVPPPVADTGQWPQPTYSSSVTGHISNPLFDVIRFDVQLFADAEQLPRVLQEFSRGRFITILNCSIQTVDAGAKEARGYFYGNKPIVQLDMNCETILLRQWTRPLMPVSTKQAMGIPLDQPKPQP